MQIHRGTVVLLAAAVLGLTTGSASQTPGAATEAAQPAAPEAPALRLPGDVVPTRQAVSLTLDPRAETFSGTVDIDVTVRAAAETIWLNARDLAIRTATLETAGRRHDLRVRTGNEHVVGFALESGPIGPGPARLRIAYDGTVSRRDMEGLFAQQEGGEWYAFTQFEPLGARRAFPCFDEPAFKIPWQVTLTMPDRDAGFSNTPEISTARGEGGRKTIVFAETKPLPSYLVAVAVGPFEIAEAGTAGRGRTPIRMLVPRGKTAEARWAVETTPRILASLEEYFDQAYPYEKLDQVAIPMFFGAMEHPGLVTYGQTLMLQKPGDETIAGRRGYVAIAAHELAHQWFGNLVTTAWWDDIWLNEAFASWMGQRVAHEFGPGWGLDVERVWARSGALNTDALQSARRVRQRIESVHDIANAFDGITYSKGEAVLEMFEAWLGVDVFRRGVREYIREHAGGNATADDFTAALSRAAGRDLAKPFSSFLDAPGAPLVVVELECAGGPPRVTVTQKPYAPLGSAGGSAALWQLPVCVRYATGGAPARACTLLGAPAATMTLEAAESCPGWLLANDGYTGYYRARHGGDLLKRLLQADAGVLTAAERVGLLTDLQALVESGDVQAAAALELAAAFAGDGNRHVVNGTMAIVGPARRFLSEGQRPAHAALVRRLYGARARSLGWRSTPGESEDLRLLRSDVLQFVGILGDDPQLARDALPLARAWLDGGDGVEADVVDAVLAVAARSGDGSLFDRLYREALTTTDRDRRERVLRALGRFRSPQLVPRALAVSLDEQIDARESLGVVFAASWDPETRDQAYEFVKTHFDALVARLPKGSAYEAASFLPFVAAGFCDAAHRQDAESFFAARVRDAAGGPRNLAQALEYIDLCVAQRRVQEPSVASFLAGAAPTSH